MADPNRYYSSTAVTTSLSSTITAGASSMTVASVSGFPASCPYTIIIDRDTATEEAVTVSNASGLTLTLSERGADGTSAQSHSAGAVVEHGVTARDFSEPQTHIAGSTNVHGLEVGSSVVGTTDVQTLSNKALESPNVDSFENAQHTHTTAAGGGNISQSAISGLEAALDDRVTDIEFMGHWGSPTTHGVTGEIVGTSDSQTLSNKSLTTPTIADFTNATHDHADAAGGGKLRQENTHEGVDTDLSSASLHHTLGTGGTQAAAGDHVHAYKAGEAALAFNASGEATLTHGLGVTPDAVMLSAALATGFVGLGVKTGTLTSTTVVVKAFQGFGAGDYYTGTLSKVFFVAVKNG